MGYIGTEREVVTVPEPIKLPQWMPKKKEEEEEVPELVPVRRKQQVPLKRELAGRYA